MEFVFCRVLGTTRNGVSNDSKSFQDSSFDVTSTPSSAASDNGLTRCGCEACRSRPAREPEPNWGGRRDWDVHAPVHFNFADSRSSLSLGRPVRCEENDCVKKCDLRARLRTLPVFAIVVVDRSGCGIARGRCYHRSCLAGVVSLPSLPKLTHHAQLPLRFRFPTAAIYVSPVI